MIHNPAEYIHTKRKNKRVRVSFDGKNVVLCLFIRDPIILLNTR